MYPCCTLSMSKQYSVQPIHYVWYIWFPMPCDFFEYSLKGLWSLFGLLGFWLCNVKKLVLFQPKNLSTMFILKCWSFKGKSQVCCEIKRSRINNVVLKVEQMVLINRQWNLCHMVNNHIIMHAQQQGCWTRINFNAMLIVITCDQRITNKQINF
jgi:hypothetical protein